MPDNTEQRILVTSLSMSMAHVVRPLEIAKVLRDMGYRVIFSGSGKAVQLAQQAGFELRYLPDWKMADILHKLKVGVTDIHPPDMVHEWVAAEVELLEDVKPVAILDDARMTTAISAPVAGIPRISIHNAYTNPSAVRGIMDPSLKAPNSLVDNLHIESFNQVRKSYDLPPIKVLFDLLEGDLILLCDVPEYAPMHTVRNHYHYVGPLIWGRDLSRPLWINELDPDRPTIYYTMGSTGPPKAFQTAIDLFSDTEFQVLMTLGSLVREEDLGPLPKRFFVASYASGDALAKRADMLVCHGGNGTAYQGLCSGNPIVSWPMLKDQYWNARRLSEIGVGVTIESPDEMLDAVSKVLTQPEYREKAEHFSKILSIYDGPKTAAMLIHRYLDRNVGN